MHIIFFPLGEKIPWNVSLRNFSVYTLHHVDASSFRALQLVKPASVSCTLGLSYKYHPQTSDNITALGLCIHSDMHPVKMALSSEQVGYRDKWIIHLLFSLS